MRAILKLRRHLLKRFAHDERAVAVVEFALILPLMLLLYLGSIEASSLLTVDRRIEVIASTVADLVARWNPGDTPFAKGDLQDYFTASQGILTPYSTAGLTQVVSFVSVTSAGVATVVWSCGYNGGLARAPNSAYDVKPNMKNLVTNTGTSSGYLIASEIRYPYKPVLGLVFTDAVNLSNEALFLPRFASAIAAPVGGCPT
jgi:Flp pilus assembly protein TadG